jgi:hypothetical protein
MMIPTVFKRDPATFKCTDEPHSYTAWVTAGQGVARRLYVGWPMLRTLLGWFWWNPNDAIMRGSGWTPFEDADQFRSDERGYLWGRLQEAIGDALTVRPGIYMLCGPDILGNQEGFESSALVAISDGEELDVPRDRAGMEKFLADRFGKLSGIVFEHPDGSLAQITPADF